MFKTVFVAFCILHVKLSESLPQGRNVVIQSGPVSESHPFLTGVKFIPYKAAARSATDVSKLVPVPSVKETLAQGPPTSADRNAKSQNPLPRPQNLLTPLNSLSSEVLDKFSLLPIFESKKLIGVELTPVSNVKNAADPTSLVDGGVELKTTDLAASVNVGPINLNELMKTIANDAAKLLSTGNVLVPLPVADSKNVDPNSDSAVKLVSSAFTSVGPAPGDQIVQATANVAGSLNTLPFPNTPFDPEITISRKLQPPAPFIFSAEESEQPAAVPAEAPVAVPAEAPVAVQQKSEQINLPAEATAGDASQPKNSIPIPTNQPAVDLRVEAAAAAGRPVAAVPSLPPIELLPPRESAAELVDTLSGAKGYGVLPSQSVVMLNASTSKQDLPLVFQRIAEPRKTTNHSPKKDVEVFAPLQPEKPVFPQPPDIPIGPPQYPFPSDGSAGGETPFVLNDYPAAFPPFLPEESPTPQLPLLPPLAPTTGATEETTRPTEETTRATEETTPKTPKTTSTVPKFTPWVPKNTPFVPKNTPWMPKNTPFVPKYTPPQQPSFTQGRGVGGPVFTTRYFPGYPPTSKIPKGMPSPIWPMFTPRPTIKVAQGANLAAAAPADEMVTPFMEKLISATSTASTPSVQVLGEPSQIEPKYKLAVVKDYKNYDSQDGTFGFSIDLENGLMAKVRGYKKDGRHIIEGSYSLFANEGDPVNITYVADNEAPEVNQPIPTQITNSVPADETVVTPAPET